MRSGDRDHDRGLPDLEHTGAVHDGHLADLPARLDLVADLGHDFLGHFRVRLVFEMHDVAAARKAAGHAAKDDHRAIGRRAYGLFQLEVVDRTLDDVEHRRRLSRH
jgi:hypothetical protein